VTTEVVPSPVATDGVVFVDVATRTLVVRLPDAADGYTRRMWREGHAALVKAEQSGFRGGTPTVWAHTNQQRQVVYGLPGDRLTLRFTFYKGESVYADLVGKPGLTATVTLDRSAQRIMGVLFHHRTAV
jgi:hypothetical protein